MGRGILQFRLTRSVGAGQSVAVVVGERKVKLLRSWRGFRPWCRLPPMYRIRPHAFSRQIRKSGNSSRAPDAVHEVEGDINGVAIAIHQGMHAVKEPGHVRTSMREIDLDRAQLGDARCAFQGPGEVDPESPRSRTPTGTPDALSKMRNRALPG